MGSERSALLAACARPGSGPQRGRRAAVCYGHGNGRVAWLL